ncbi:hypothetical protein [Massilicoli timonensis]|uniref:hypothetical protein n=1 Tax=Massilicoli timonensis TaxID=2015901 RepID=UPI003AAC5B95
MATATCSTSITGITLVCDYSYSAVGDYPNTVMRVSYSFKLRKAYSNNAIHGTVDFWFHTKHHSVRVDTEGAGDTGVLASGSVDIAWGTRRTVSHAPGFGVTSTWGYTGSSTVVITGTIPAPKFSAGINSYTYKSATFDVYLETNPNNFYKVKVYNDSGYLYADNVGSSVTITGLSPNTGYTFHIETWCKDDSGSAVQMEPFYITTKKPPVPTAGKVTISNITPFTATGTISGFTMGDMASLSYYRYKVLNSAGTEVISLRSNGTSTTINLSGLSEETTYTLYVDCIDNYGQSNSGWATASFTTLVDQAKIYIKDAGTWKQGKIYVKQSGTWQKVKKIYVKQSGTWKQGR